MDWALLILILHIVGVAMGAGGALATDTIFLRTIWDKKISRDELGLIEAISKVVIGGLALLILSGLALLVFHTYYLGNPVFWVKMTIVAILTANGIAFHKKVLPLLREYRGKSLSTSEVKNKLWLLALTGGLSGVSWYSVLALGVLMRVLDWPYLFVLNIYLLLVVGAVLSAYLMLYVVLFVKFKRRSIQEYTKKNKKEEEDDEPEEEKEEKKDDSESKKVFRFPGKYLFVITGIVFLIGALGLAFVAVTSSEGEEHFVCIHEAPPWFTPDVLYVEEGDTVTWHHCDEDAVDYNSSAIFNLGIQAAKAHDDNGDGEHNHIHTHPILSIEGPEEFSSGLRPVGHLEDGNEFRHTFTEEGIYTYICPTHPYMKGIIAVGEEYHTDSLWPPEENIDPEDVLSAPVTPGIGEIWVNTQFEHVEGQRYPGTITVLDAETWETKEVISHESFNNPHNLWNSYDNQYIFQTQWHSDGFSKIDAQTKEVIDTVELGNAPAHLFVHPSEEKVYVTLNNESSVKILDFDLNVIGEIETSYGPHGIWIDPSGKWMSVAATLDEKLDIIDLETEEVVETFDAPGLPLATQITNDGRYAMISLLLEGEVMFIDLETMEHVESVEVGEMPVWAMPDPSGNYVFVPNTGSADISVISLETMEVVNTLPAAAGAHGITFGPKEGGGYYGYVSNKYARYIGVIDLDEMETLGYIELHEGAWGGNGILTLPNNYVEHISQ